MTELDALIERLTRQGLGLQLCSEYGDDLVGHTYPLTGRWEAIIYTPDAGSFRCVDDTPVLAIAAALKARSAR